MNSCHSDLETADGVLPSNTCKLLKTRTVEQRKGDQLPISTVARTEILTFIVLDEKYIYVRTIDVVTECSLYVEFK